MGGQYQSGTAWMYPLGGASRGAGEWEGMDRYGCEATNEGVDTWTKEGTLGVTKGRECELHELD
jgi:hypothetical protein